MPDSLGNLLKTLRQRQGWSLRGLASHARVDDAMLSRWERGEYQPQIVPLNQVLDCLAASVDERWRALSMLKGPRALAALRTLSSVSTADEADCIDWRTYLPHAGDVWRALRERHDIKQSEVAAIIGCNIATVSRWEKGAAPPPYPKQPLLLTLFGASPREHAMLHGGGVTLPLPRRPVTLERCEWMLAALVNRLDRGLPIDDGHFFALEALLWQHVHRRENALAPLVETYTWHGEWLVRWGRPREMQRYAEQSLALTDYLFKRGAGPSAWARAVYLMARCDAVRQPADALHRIHTWLAKASLPVDEANLCREAASYASSTRNFHAAEAFILRGRRALLPIGEPTGLHLNSHIHSQILLRAGDASGALDRLPEQREDCPFQSIQDSLLRADVLLALQQKAEAVTTLARCTQIVEEYGLTHHRTEIQNFERRF